MRTYRNIVTKYGDIIKRPTHVINPDDFTPVTQEILNSLEVDKEYLICCGYNTDGLYGTAYKHENGNIYLKFGNVSVYDDWKTNLNDNY